MKLSVKDINLAETNGNWGIWFNIPNTLVDKFKKLAEKDCLKSIEVKQYREKRSLDANAYCHVLIEAIAKLLTSTHDEIYEQMLHDYGVHKYPVCTPKKIATYKQDYKFVEVMNKLRVETKNGQLVDAVQLKCTTGSSKYDSLQMYHFIEGIKTECDTLGIETKSPEELKRMANNYEGSK